MSSFMSGQEIYENFQNGDGPEGLSASAAIVHKLAGRYQDRAEQVSRLRTRMEAAWEGEAAGAAQRGLGPLVTEHDQSGDALDTAQDLTGRQAGSFGEARNKVVPVPPAPTEVDPLVALTDPTTAVTYYQQVIEHNRAAQHNVDVMNGYTGASQYNTDGLPASYGELTDDQAGITVGAPGTIDSESFDPGDPGPRRGSAPEPGPGGDSGDRQPVGGGGGPEPTPAAERDPGVTPGTTTPGSYLPAVSAPLAPGTDPGPGQVRAAPVGGTTPGVGVGVPLGTGPRGGGAGGPRGGVTGGAPRGGLPGGPGAGAGRSAAGRSGPLMAPGVAGPGRGGVGFGGVPGGGRGQGADDTERKTPAYLDGGDPEELFDTDQLTAPPAIGAEDD